jgi:hypothetical protein
VTAQITCPSSAHFAGENSLIVQKEALPTDFATFRDPGLDSTLAPFDPIKAPLSNFDDQLRATSVDQLWASAALQIKHAVEGRDPIRRPGPASNLPLATSDESFNP